MTSNIIVNSYFFHIFLQKTWIQVQAMLTTERPTPGKSQNLRLSENVWRPFTPLCTLNMKVITIETTKTNIAT